MDILGLNIRYQKGKFYIRRNVPMPSVSGPVDVASPGYFADRTPAIKVQVPERFKPALIRLVKDPVLGYNTDRFRGRGAFHPAEYDLAEVGRISDTDSYVRQAFDKKIALMFKEGWDVVGSNPKTVKYIRSRFEQISRASGIPTPKLFRRIGSSLIQKSNAFLIKVRDITASGGKVRTEPGKQRAVKPIAAYFVVPAETMEYQLSNGKIVKWRQRMTDGAIKEWKPEDVVHFYYNKKDGFVFGTPGLVPVVDDIRALRKIEENIELLVYQHLFPLFQYKVGTPEEPAGFTEAGDLEVDLVKKEIQYMPTEGGIVTPHRHEIKAIGSEGRALRAEGYLEHFKKRVFSGLGLSAVDFGEGETANRATSDNMSRNLVDSIKDLQQVMEIFITNLVIVELLLESTFGSTVLDEENICRLVFKEIDVDAQIKKEAHYADQFNKDIITWDEARIATGKDPIAVPSQEESESGDDLSESFPEWFKTRWKLFDEPKVMLQSIDEPYTPLAKAVARANAVGVTSGDVSQAAKEQKERDIEVEKEKVKAKKAAAPVKKKDGFIRLAFSGVENSVIMHIEHENNLDHDWISARIRAEMSPVFTNLVSRQLLAFRNGYASTRIPGSGFIETVAVVRSRLQSRAEHYLDKLIRDTLSALKRNVDDNMTPADMALKARAVFNSLVFRTDFIEDVEIRKAFNLGVAIALKEEGFQEMVLVAQGTDRSCGECAVLGSSPVDLQFIILDRVPPFHAACNCGIGGGVKINFDVEDDTKKSSAEDPTGLVSPKSIATCPECNKIAILKKGTPDIFNCRACGHSFRRVEDDQPVDEDKENDTLEDGAKLESRVLKVNKK